MKKSTIVPLIVFVVLAGGLYYVFATLQINLFEGKVTRHDYFLEKDITDSHAYSFGEVMEGKASLDGKGWAMMIGIIAGIPLIISLLIRVRLKRKERKRLAAIHANHAANETVA